MSVIRRIWEQRDVKAQKQSHTYLTDPSFRSLPPHSPGCSQWKPVSPSAGSRRSPPWPFPLIRDGNRHCSASVLILVVNLCLTHAGWTTSSSCSPQSTSEVQLRVVELATERERKRTREVGFGLRCRSRGACVKLPCTYTKPSTHTHLQKSWLAFDRAELLRWGEYYPSGTSFTSSIFTEFLCVLLLLIIPANHTHTYWDSYHHITHYIFMSMSVVRVIIEIIMGCGEQSDASL